MIRQNEISLGKESVKWGIYAYIITPHHTERTHQGVSFSAVTGKKTGKNRVCIYPSEETKTKDTATISLEKRGLHRVAVHFPLKYVVLPEVDEFQKEGTSKISVSMDCASKQRTESNQVPMP